LGWRSLPPILTEFTLVLPQAAIAEVQDYLQKMKANPGTYSLMNNQCTSVALRALEAAGVTIKKFNITNGGPTYFTADARLLSPGEFRGYLEDPANWSFVTKERYFKAN